MNPEEYTPEEIKMTYSSMGELVGFSHFKVMPRKDAEKIWKPRKVTDPRVILIEQLMAELDFPVTDFKKIRMQTKDFTEDEIRQCWQTARSWKKNPRALFWKLVKEKRAEIKKQLSVEK